VVDLRYMAGKDGNPMRGRRACLQQSRKKVSGRRRLEGKGMGEGRSGSKDRKEGEATEP